MRHVGETTPQVCKGYGGGSLWGEKSLGAKEGDKEEKSQEKRRSKLKQQAEES